MPCQTYLQQALKQAVCLAVVGVTFLGCELTEDPLRVEADPRLDGLASGDTAAAGCGGRACRREEVCDVTTAGQRCVPSCSPAEPSGCDDDQACVGVAGGVTGCLSRCDPFTEEACSGIAGCIVSDGESVCVLKRDTQVGQPCATSVDCDDHLVCEQEVCRQPCRDGADSAAADGCAGASCERIVDGLGVCL